MPLEIAAAIFAAGMIYAITPGPGVLALFTLVAANGRPAGAKFLGGHLVGDVMWGTLALAAIIGVSRLGPALFEALGVACGLYLVWLGWKAVTARKGATGFVIGAERALSTGVIFGLTNPKSYPVSLAMFTAFTATFAAELTWPQVPLLMAVATVGFVAGGVVLVVWAGLPIVRAFFTRHGLWVTRIVGATFILFGAKSLLDAAQSFRGRA